MVVNKKVLKIVTWCDIIIIIAIELFIYKNYVVALCGVLHINY